MRDPLTAAGMKSFPPKRTAHVGGGVSLEYVTSGVGSPAVVLVNGSGGPIEGWHKVYPQLEGLGTVFAYNRLGVGGSSRPSEPQAGDVVVETLRALLLQADLRPPYVLVGHSLGGLFVNLFARTFPTEVAGVVLLDATAPEDVGVMAAYQSALQRFAQRALDTVLRKNECAETENVSRTVDLIDRSGPFPAIPLIVVTGGKPALFRTTPVPARAARAEHQRRLAAMSPDGSQVVAGQSGHFPQFTEPGVVVEAVSEVVSRVRRCT